MRRVVVGIAAVALAGCSGGGAGTATSAGAPSSAAVPSGTSSSGPSSAVPTAAPAPALTPTTTAVHAAVVDDLLDHRITLTRMTRGLTSVAAPGREVVLLEVDVTPGARPGPKVGSGSFVADGAQDVTSSVQALVAQRGLTALPAQVTAPTKGAVALAITPGAKLAVSYLRPMFRTPKGRIFGDRLFPLVP